MQACLNQRKGYYIKGSSKHILKEKLSYIQSVQHFGPTLACNSRTMFGRRVLGYNPPHDPKVKHWIRPDQWNSSYPDYLSGPCYIIPQSVVRYHPTLTSCLGPAI